MRVISWEAIKTREGIVRSKGNVILLKLVKKDTGRVTEVHSTADAADPAAQPELVRLGWRYEQGMRQLSVDGDKTDPWHPSNGMFATVDVRKCAMEATAHRKSPPKSPRYRA